MEQKSVRVKIADLKPGMGIERITGFSSEFSYLDSKKVASLNKLFKGATVAMARQGKKSTVPMDFLKNGDQLTEISSIPAGLGYGKLDEQSLVTLKETGCQEFLATSSTDTVLSAPLAAPPKFGSAGRSEHKKNVGDARNFLEKVDLAGSKREESSRMVEDLFSQGRAGRHTTKPAMETVEEILSQDVSSAMTAVAGLRSSDQTYAHCVDMSVIFNEATLAILKATGQSLNEKLSRSTLAAGFMHDIGKSQVPKDILESTERFAPESQEMKLMRSHVGEGAQILSDAGMDEAMINVAHFHHVKKDTTLVSSYPEVDYKEVMPLTRLAAIVDVYQALIGKRSYKPNWVPGKAVKYLRSLRGSEFDEPMMDNFLKVMGMYPVGSLVRLSSGDLAFVTKIAGKMLEKPVVVVAENAKGERLSSNPLCDLELEPEISITEVVDHYEHFNESEDQAFQVFKSLRVV